MNTIWFIFITVVFIGIQGSIYRKFGMRKLDYQRYYSVSRCFTGDQVEMVERISNNKLLPVPWVKLESSLSAQLKFVHQQIHSIREGKLHQNHRSLFTLMPYTQIIRRHKFICARRGVYDLSSATLTVGDLFGIYSMYSMMAFEHRLIVYPQPLLPDGFSRPYNSQLGDITVRRWIVSDPFMFAGVREYQYGDPMRDLNWKATARSGRMQVNQHDFTAERRVMVYLNVEDHEKMWNQVSNEELIERGISYAAGLIQEAIHAGMEAGFVTNGCMSEDTKEPINIEAEGGRGHYEQILEHMARMKIARSMSFEQLLEQEVLQRRSNLDIVLVTAYMNDQLYERKQQLEYNGNIVSILLLEGQTYTSVEDDDHLDLDRSSDSIHRSFEEVASTVKAGAGA